MLSITSLIKQQSISYQNHNQSIKSKKQPMSKNQPLCDLLNEQNLTARRLFSSKNILSEIKYNIEAFVHYALRHKKFIYDCLEIALETSQEGLEKENDQNVAFNICEVICCDEPVLADLFFEPISDQQRKNSEISENIEIEEPETIQTEAQRLFCDSEEDEKIKKLETNVIEIQKNEIAKKSLQILKTLNNESSLGYLYKIWSFFIRNNSNQVIEFFDSNREHFHLLINNLRYPSVSNLLAQIIVSEDRTKEYKYENFKKEIIETVIKTLIENKQDSELYEGVGILLEEVFNSSKQSYCQNFEDFKRQVNYFFSSEVVQKFFNILLEKDEKSFENVLKYYELLLNRVNSEKEDIQNRHQDQTQSFVKFQIQTLVAEFLKLIKLLSEISGFNSILKINFVNFLIQVVDTPQFEESKSQINFIEIFQQLINVFCNEKSKGLYKMKLSKLVEKVINFCAKQDLEGFVKKNPDFFTKFYPSIQSINMDNSKIYNKNELVGFECQILFQIQKKLPGSVDTSSKIHQKNLKRMQKKYETKIANYGRPNESINLEEVGSFTFNEIPALRLPQGFKINSLSTDRKGPLSSRGSESKEEKKNEGEVKKVETKDLESKITEDVQVTPTTESKKDQQNQPNQVNQVTPKPATTQKEQAISFYIRHISLVQ